MNKYWWLVFMVCMVITVDLPGQTKQSGYYRYRLKEQVMADYHNLLDTARGRNYRTIEKYFSGRLFVYSINESTTFIHWNPDTVQEQRQSVQTVKAGWKAVFSTGADEQWGSTLYSDTIIPPYWLNQLKMIVGSARFKLASSSQVAEPSPDGVFNVAYTIQEKNRSSIRVEKTKEAIYPPGIPFYRICIDSFRAVYHYDQSSGLLQNGFSYEVKRQKIGQRVLARVSSETKVESCETFLNAVPETTGWEHVYTRAYPVFSRLGYAERAVKQAMNYEPVYTLKALFQPEAASKADTGLYLTGRIRSSILRGSLSYKAIRDLLDTVSLGSNPYAMLEDALVEAGTEDAQDILADLAGREGEPVFFYKRLIIKAGITAPLHSKKLLAKLIAIRADTTNPGLASVAGLALANNAGLMQDEGMQKERDQILEFLRMTFLNSARQQSDSLQWLQESGNAGDERVLNMAGYCLTANTSELYQEALHSIRFIHGAKADSILAMQLIINGKENLGLLTDVCKLRYPSIKIRSAFYQLMRMNQALPLSAVQPFIDYLVSWQDEIRTLPAELLPAVSGMKEVENYSRSALRGANN
jgi:hypothetical protein